MFRNLKLVFVISIVICISLQVTGCSLLPKEEEALKPPLVKPPRGNYTTVKAEVGDVVRTVNGSGKFESYASEVAQFKGQGGRIQSINVKAGDFVKKGDVLVQLNLDDLDLRVKEAELALERAKLAYKQAAKAAESDEQTLKIARLSLEIEQMKFERLAEQLKNKQLVATIDGKVTYAENLKEGDYVEPYQTLVIVSDPTQLRISLPVESGSDHSEVLVGIPVEITFNNNIYEGEVVQTPSSAPYTENKQLTERYAKTIYIELKQIPEDVEIGSSANIKIITQERKDVIKIPKSGLRSYLGRNFVRILEDGDKLREVDVQPGLSTSTEVEIIEGVEAGQEIVLQ